MLELMADETKKGWLSLQTSELEVTNSERGSAEKLFFEEIAPPSSRRGTSKFRRRDSLGALRPRQAEIDAAFTRGYILGLEAGKVDALEDLRTLLFNLLEELLGEPTEAQLDLIANASQKTLTHWILMTPLKDSVAEVLS
jgi:hypothetical protein